MSSSDCDTNTPGALPDSRGAFLNKGRAQNTEQKISARRVFTRVACSTALKSRNLHHCPDHLSSHLVPKAVLAVKARFRRFLLSHTVARSFAFAKHFATAPRRKAASRELVELFRRRRCSHASSDGRSAVRNVRPARWSQGHMMSASR